MILGFAHLTRSTAEPAEVIAALTRDGMAVTAHHKDVPSAQEKWPLLDRQARSHELALLAGSPAIEVVSHDTGTIDTESRLALDSGRSEIRVKVRDQSAVGRFFAEGLGFRATKDGALRLDSRFPQWSVTVRLLPDADAPIDPPLDLEGWSCLAFYATNPEADAAHLRAHGGRDGTAVFPVSWTGSRMSIAMLRDPEGTIIELVKILDRK
jgi:hypothetical protein